MTDSNVVIAAEAQEDRLTRLTAEVSERRKQLVQLDAAIEKATGQLATLQSQFRERLAGEERRYADAAERVTEEYAAKTADFNATIAAKREELAVLRADCEASKESARQLKEALVVASVELTAAKAEARSIIDAAREHLAQAKVKAERTMREAHEALLAARGEDG